MLIDIINEIPSILQYFVPGFIFLKLFSFFASKKTKDITLLSIGSVVVSFIFISVLDLMGGKDLGVTPKVLICSGIGVILGVLFAKVFKKEWMSDLFRWLGNKSVNDSIFVGLLDYKKGNAVKIVTKNKLEYTGFLSQIEENGINSWVAISSYDITESDTGNIIVNTEEEYKKSILIINLSTIERMEIIKQ